MGRAPTVRPGFDRVDVAAARRHGVLVRNVPHYATSSVAQLVFALLLELCHHVALHDAAVHAGEWTRSSSFSFWRTPLVELVGKTIGVVGIGRNLRIDRLRLPISGVETSRRGLCSGFRSGVVRLDANE
jgi:hypothetical protein